MPVDDIIAKLYRNIDTILGDHKALSRTLALGEGAFSTPRATLHALIKEYEEVAASLKRYAGLLSPSMQETFNDLLVTYSISEFREWNEERGDWTCHSPSVYLPRKPLFLIRKAAQELAISAANGDRAIAQRLNERIDDYIADERLLQPPGHASREEDWRRAAAATQRSTSEEPYHAAAARRRREREAPAKDYAHTR
ncbi:hypothetical protein JXA12_00215 [Candidatus Woesearchaeota archaeon]|nr:hypothetical protein [Candidatus Woesearchaeota archaeon]